MRCLRIPRRYTIYSLFVLFSFFFTFCFSSSSVSAASDLTFTLSSSASSICTDWTSSYDSLCGYHYVILEDLNGRGVAVRCSLTLPDNLHSYDLSTSYASFAVLSPHLSSGFNYSSVSCRGVSPSASIRMTLTDSYIPSSPSGSLSITENGTFDVSSYAEAVVDVPATVVQGDYHDDLVNIRHAIIICGALLLIIYFFYCIYRMIIKSTGGNS